MTTEQATKGAAGSLGRERWWWLALAAAAVWVVYSESRAFDFWYDDPIALRPWALHDVLAAFGGGRWEPWGVWDVFYRPLATGTYALAFEVFGVNLRALFLVALADLIAIVWLTALFVRRETHSPTLAVVAALIAAVHPSLPRSVGTWFTNLPHGLATILALAALLYWQRCRTRGDAAWWPLGLLVAAGFLLKEDMLMLAPALVALQALRARWVGDVRLPSRAIVLSAAGLFAGLFALRWTLLGGFGGHEMPDDVEMLRNGLRGPFYVLAAQSSPYYLIGAGRGALWLSRLAGLFLPAVLASGLAATALVPRPRSWLVVAGLTLFAAFNVPQLWWSGPTAFHLLTMSAGLALVGSISSIGPTVLRAVGPIAGASGLAAGLVVMAGASRVVVHQLGPCGVEAAAGDSWMQSVPQLPPEMRQALAARRASCDASSTTFPVSRSMPVITWGVRELDAASPADRVYVWAADRVVAEIAPGATEVTVEVRAADAAPDAPVPIGVVADGARASSIILVSSAWQMARISLNTNLGTRLRGMHRLDLSVAGSPRGTRRIDMRPIRISPPRRSSVEQLSRTMNNPAGCSSCATAMRGLAP